MNRIKGFSLVEILVTLIVAGIMAMVALPQFNNVTANSYLVSQSNQLVSTLTFARSESIKLSRSVTVSSISGSVNWSDSGYRVYLDNNNDNSFNSGDLELRQIQNDSEKLLISADLNTLTFNPSGLVSSTALFEVCDDRNAENGFQINLLGGGSLTSKKLTCS